MSRRTASGGGSPSIEFWFEAEPEELRARLADANLALSAESIAAIRDRSAASLLSDPAFSYDLSTLLLRRVRSHGTELARAGVAIAWRCRAEACRFTGRLRQARQAYQRASDAAAGRRESALLGQILVGRMALLSLLGETAESERLARQAERLLEKAGDDGYLGKLHMNRGNAFYRSERHAEALDAYGKASRVFASTGQRNATWGSLLVNQAIACTNLSRVGEARRLFDEAEAQSLQLDLPALLAQVRFNRAFLEALVGDYRSALAQLEEASRSFAEQGQRDLVAASQRSLAEIYLKLGLVDEAGELARASAESFAAEGMEMDAALSRIDAARASLGGDSPADGIALLEEARAYFGKKRIRSRATQIRLLLARGELERGEAGRATALARRALRGFESLGMTHATVEARRVLAESLLLAGRAPQAEEALAPALKHVQGLATDERVKLWESAGRVARARGKRRQAAAFLARARGQLELLAGLIPGIEFRASALAAHAGVYHESIALAMDGTRARFADLLPLIEAARARGFRERIALTDSEESVPPDLHEERAELGLLTRRIEEAEFAGQGVSDPDGLERMRRQALAAEKRIITGRRRAQARSGRGFSGLAELPEPARLSQLLAVDESLLQYYVGGGKILCLILGRDGGSLHTLDAHPEEIRATLDAIRFQFQAVALDPGNAARIRFLLPAAERLLRDLHSKLVEPVAGLIPRQGRLTIVPHDLLHAVPFECLMDGEGYLVDRYLIQRAPTAGFLARRGEARARRKRRIIVSGSVSSGLAHVRREMAAVAGHLRSAGREVEVHEDPSSEELLALLPAGRLLHLSTHGLFRGDNPLFSRLSTRDGAIFLADVVGLRLEADLIVLSACESGQVLAGRGDELDGVAHGFLAAGASRLVASRWRVHDAATVSLMDRFYRHLAGQRSWNPALALTLAAREARVEWSHPFFWGAFSVYGV